MSTRKLILAALACGLAILLAGGVQLFLLSRGSNQASVLAEGATTKVATVQVTVVSSTLEGAEVVAVVRLAPTLAVGDAAEGWALNANGLQTPRTPSDGPVVACQGKVVAPGASLTCRVAFAAGKGSRLMSYARGDLRAVWLLNA